MSEPNTKILQAHEELWKVADEYICTIEKRITL